MSKAGQHRSHSDVRGILLQEVVADVDKRAGPTVVGELVDKRFGLLNESLDGRGARFAETDCFRG